MDNSLDLPKLRNRDSDIPRRVLLVDDDELELSLMSDRLHAAGIEVCVAHNGEEALACIEKQWFPIVLTDWQMPVMDGIQLVEQLRERGGGDSYFIMLSVRAQSEDYDRGYCAGVDDYLSKKSPDTEIMARIEAGLNTVALRRSLRQSRATLAVTQSLTSEREGKALLIAKLQPEIARAKRYRRPVSLLMLGLQPASKEDTVAIAPALADECLVTLQGVVRIDIDSPMIFEATASALQLAVVLPETGPAEVSVIRGRVRAALLERLREETRNANGFDVSVGAASVDPSVDNSKLTAEDMIVAAENCRRCMSSCGARRLAAVQSSVVKQVAIPCRYGYAVADHCLELDHRYADVRAVLAARKESAA